VSFVAGRVGEAELQSALRDIEAAAQRGAQLAKQLLTFSHGEDQTPRQDPIELAKVIGSLASFLARVLPEQVRLTVHAEPGLSVRADATQLQQVLLNLCLNARDAMPDGGDLVVTAESVMLSDADAMARPFLAAGAHARLRVVDNGCGMSEEVRRRAFEPFFTTKAPGKGTGLGLAVVYRVVQTLAGHVAVDTAPGRGTTFTVHLPLAPPAPTVEDTDRFETPRRVTVGGSKLLVVDDEPLLREALRRLLAAMGYVVLTADDGEQALAIYREHHQSISLVILDLAMPHMGGEEAFYALRQIRPDARVLITSGYAEQDAVRSLLAAGAVGFLPKPVDAKKLLRALVANDDA
jgi:CheY-like chemotaxis protein/two-component sensor histidine kinase